jgi:3-methyl-2-oxobutanoate hydroxymethyltransferase
MNVHDFAIMKKNGQKVSVVTCYDYWSAKIVAMSNVDCVLVGDSLAMVMHGHPNTLHADVELMTLHIQAVVRGLHDGAKPVVERKHAVKFIVGDMPFLSYRKDLNSSMTAVEKIMRAGAHAVKLEGATGNEALIQHIVASGVPVMGHLGLTPQSLHQLGGHRVQGKEQSVAADLLADALKLEEAGCFAIVLECVPAAVAADITAKLQIPTIGIGAGAQVSGQVLVLQDLLGMDREFQPKFLKKYLDGANLLCDALNQYDREVKDGAFPAAEHCY